jgi:hypothetical protein
VLARNKERTIFTLFLLVLIISISTHLFIHLTFSVSLILIQYFFYWKKHSRGVIYILRQYSVSKSYSLKLYVTRLYRDYQYPFVYSSYIFRQSDPTKYLNTTNICRQWFRKVRHNEFYLFNY